MKFSYDSYVKKQLQETVSKDFRLLTLEIKEPTDKRYLKVLTPGIYKLSNSVTEEYSKIMPILYGSKISVQAIVGGNGAGKSTFLDFLYRLINNFSYLLLSHANKSKTAYPLAYVNGIYAQLTYSIDGQMYRLICKNRSMALETPSKQYRLGEYDTDFSSYQDCKNLSNWEIRDIMRHNFFYTIVTNYAFSSFLSEDYMNEDTLGLKGVSWIDSLFHKNDGYKVPIVLNPFRHDGKLDVAREMSFATSRLIAILTSFELRSKELISGYGLQSITYTYDPYSFLVKLLPYLPESHKEIDRSPENIREIEDVVLKAFVIALRNPNSYANIVCREWELQVNSFDKIQLMACLYFVYKTFTIIGTYTEYADYAEYGNLANCFRTFGQYKHPSEEIMDVFPKIVKRMKEDTSHITFKLKRTKQFITNKRVANLVQRNNPSGFSLDEYLRAMQNDIKATTRVETILNHLPMPIFKPHIYLKKENSSRDIIPFEQLSSGEKQFLNTISTIIYHVLNLKSIPTSRICYRIFNIVLDEMELCFHPEMQREFVSKFISTIRSLRFNRFCSFNILLVTHSPFVLSDIIKDNILFLKDGKDVSSSIQVNPFGSNVNDVLSQAFFLKENGFLGNIAQDSIKKLIDFLQDDNQHPSKWNQESAGIFIDNLIGDPLLQDLLREMYNSKFKYKEIDA